MHLSSAFLGSCLVIGSLASPTPVPVIDCKAVNSVVSALKLLPTALPFCSSFLSIQTSTSKVTRTVTVPKTATISAITGTKTITAPAVTVTSPTTKIITTCVPVNAPWEREIQKRAATTPSPAYTLPPGLSTIKSSAISSACSCLGITTPTVTITASATAIATTKVTTKVATTVTIKPTSTVVSTATSIVTACPNCDNDAYGLQYGVWYNSQPRSDDTYSTFDPTRYKSDRAEFSGNGTTNVLGMNTAGCNAWEVCPGLIYTTPTQSLGYFVVDHRGYLYAPTDGTYEIAVDGNDDIVLIWVDDVAYSGWTRGNAILDAPYYNPQFFTFPTLTGGQWHPFRLLWANAGGSGNLDIDIRDPDGNSIAGSATPNSPNFKQYTCDGQAPQYPPWNAET